MRVAIIHDWLTGMRGGENCLEVFCEIFPKADLFTLIHIPGSVSPKIEKFNIKTSFLQHIPMSYSRYREMLPLMPSAIRSFELRDYDFILSSSHCVAKGVLGGPNTFHLSYCYTPMRYAWSAYDEYFGNDRLNWPMTYLVPKIMKYLRRWDFESNSGVSDFVAISHTVSERIKKYYGRNSEILYCPVDTDLFQSTSSSTENYYLVVSAFAPYKRIDLAVKAFNILGLPLKIVGGGQDFEAIRRIANPNIEFLGWKTGKPLVDLYSKCRAFIFPGEEDFGITPLEAQACGRPVIALGAGGALETVIGVNSENYSIPMGRNTSRHMQSDPTGLFFKNPEVEDLVGAIEYFEKNENYFSSESARSQAEHFSRHKFKNDAQEMFMNAFELFKSRNKD